MSNDKLLVSGWSQVLDDPLRLDHEKGPLEPLLWIADATCGAVVAHRCGNPEFMNKLLTVMTVIDISK
jgi:hypothetical protein